MRIVGEIAHERLKISIFKMDNKLSVKFEAGLMEQIYKFRADYPTETVDDIRRLVTPQFIESVEKNMEIMYKIRLDGLESVAKNDDEPPFPHIV